MGNLIDQAAINELPLKLFRQTMREFRSLASIPDLEMPDPPVA
jgi:hypothetical protein